MESRVELANEALLEEPHFDEEATVLSARPVVPLDEVRSVDRRHDRLRLAMVIGVALLVGAFASALIYKLAGNNQGSTVVDEKIEAVKPVPLGSGAAGDAESSAEPQIKASEPVQVPQPVAKSSAPATPQHSVKTAIAREDEWQREKDLERAEKREARKQRRAEKEARRRGESRPRRVGDTVGAIEEIFEGVRRP